MRIGALEVRRNRASGVPNPHVLNYRWRGRWFLTSARDYVILSLKGVCVIFLAARLRGRRLWRIGVDGAWYAFRQWRRALRVLRVRLKRCSTRA